MRVTAIQSQNGPKQELKKGLNFNTSLGKGLMTDSFTKGNTISFKGTDGAIKGGVVGAIIGGVVGVVLVAATAGTAIPFLAAYYAGLAGTTAAGAAIGNKIEGKDK